MNWHALSWIINEECNLNCAHCYPSSTAKKKGHYTEDRIRILTHNLASMHFDKVYLSGGEPLLCPQLADFLEIASHIGDRLYICTNATCLNAENLDLLRRHKAKITISLQHTDISKSIAVYGDNHTASTIMGKISMSRSLNIPIKLEVTVMRINHQDLRSFFNFALIEGVSELDFKRYRPVGRGKEAASKFALTPEENLKALETIYYLSREYQEIEVSSDDPLYGIIRERLQKKEQLTSTSSIIPKHDMGTACKAGRRWIGIGPNGEISPCPLLLYCGVIIGNIFNQSLESIMKSSAMLENLQNNRCNRCTNSRICGGCRVCAYLHSNDLYSTDPMCPFVQESGDINV